MVYITYQDIEGQLFLVYFCGKPIITQKHIVQKDASISFITKKKGGGVKFVKVQLTKWHKQQQQNNRKRGP
jgi:hypothetical protein